MRKFHVFTVIVLCLAATTIICAQGAATKIAIVDTMKVANECKEGKRIQSVLKSFHDQKQNEINTKEAELKALEEKIKDPKFAEDKKDDYRSQFNTKMYEYQAFSKAAQDDMEGRTEKMQGEFQVKLAAVIAKYSQSKGISIVIEKGICLFNADALDITSDIIAEINKVHPGN